ncbi:hypothetical protein AOL_s00083g330 [Orbilia oligospora ATCC 24927]|uniref:Uncharacterized protein n=1 Tax=Arthrobotrys oligospora (strain ATCC 24927 / CBS 115.81 / DSM 1491) TaxID=756982 RepID=G1XH49_ARTOA|nr:hypothetical protein AOL_s00083g330 [Orbilia oligospora ATCC 24927]EGX47521.1 hypothetical protein AOL_s00083g330 [Orbilia oligospora ATCC 24927]
MAYRVPQHRLTSTPQTQQPKDRPSLSGSAFGQSATAGSEEWVVFSPTSDAQTVKTPTSGRVSRISDLGSLQYDSYDDELEDEEESQADGMGDEEEEDEEEEDDDEDYDEDIDLHGFQNPYHQGPVMLPQHDGLGTFPSAVSRQGSLEKYEPEPAILPSRNSFTNARIQAWRMEQSRILLDEIERATKGRLGLRQTEAERLEEDMATMSDVGLEEANERALADDAVDNATFWERIRRKLVQDIMGLDDMVLQIIFGEALPAEFEKSISGASTPTATEGTGLKRMDAMWEERLFERLARELGVLAQYYTPDVAKAAFSTYVTGGAQDSTGVPSIAAKPRSIGPGTPLYALYPSLRSSTSFSTLDPLSSTRQFRPTIDGEDDTDSHAANWGIEDRPLTSSLHSASSEARVDAEIVREYWEKELNVRMLFSYLKSKLATAPTAIQASPATAPTTRRPSASSTATARTVPAINYRYSSASLNQPLHQQHPLISHAQTVNNTTKAKRISPIASLTSVLGVGMGGFRSGSSCASQSTTKKSGPKVASKGTVSSKHFWDVGSTVGSSRSSCVGGPVWADV